MKVIKNEQGKWDILDADGNRLETKDTRAQANEWKKAQVAGEEGNAPSKTVEPESEGVNISTTPIIEEVVVHVQSMGETAVAAPVAAPAYDFDNMTRDGMFSLLRQVGLLIGALGSPDGITNAQADTLQFLLGSKTGVPQKDIATGVGCTGGNVTMLVDNLQKKNLVERVRLPEDRRVILVSLTDEGVKVAKEVQKTRKVAMNAIFQLAESEFGQAEVAIVARFLNALLPR